MAIKAPGLCPGAFIMEKAPRQIEHAWICIMIKKYPGKDLNFPVSMCYHIC